MWSHITHEGQHIVDMCITHKRESLWIERYIWYQKKWPRNIHSIGTNQNSPLQSFPTKARLDVLFIFKRRIACFTWSNPKSFKAVCLLLFVHAPQCRAANSTRSLYLSETKDFTFRVGWPLPFAGDTYFNPITVVRPNKRIS